MTALPVLCAFDLDGTLIDSGRDIHLHLADAMADAGLRRLSLEETLPLVGHGAADLVRRAVGGDDTRLHARVLAGLRARYLEQPVVHTVAYPGAREALDALRAARVTCALVTNKPLAITTRILERLGLAEAFAAVEGAREGVPLKPAPDMLQHAMSAAGADPCGTVMVGDSTVDLETARNAGCVFVGVAFGMDGGAALRQAGVTDLEHGLPGVVDRVLHHRVCA